MAAYATAKGQVIGVRMGELTDEEDEVPWLRTPSRRKRKVMIDGPFPAQVHAVLDQQLFIGKAGLPPAFINRIKRIAAFQNPEFYKKQAMLPRASF